jgi:hypothetical protein
VVKAAGCTVSRQPSAGRFSQTPLSHNNFPAYYHWH